MAMADSYVDAINQLDASDHYEDALYELGVDDVRQVDNETTGKRRWYSVVEDTFECVDGSYFRVSYCEPATEMQEGQDWDCEAVRVEPYEVTATKYRPVKAAF